MFCDRCGVTLQPSHSFCWSCGKPVQFTPPPPPPPPRFRSRVSCHVRMLGTLWLSLSVLRLIPGLFLISVFNRGRFHYWGDFGPPAFFPGLMHAAGGLMVVYAIAGIIAGWGLLQRRPWARVLAIVLGCFSLLNKPFGTILGIYTLWVLLPSRAELEYRQISRPA